MIIKWLLNGCYRVIVEQKTGLLQSHQLFHCRIADGQIIQQIQRLVDDLLAIAPILQIGDAE